MKAESPTAVDPNRNALDNDRLLHAHVGAVVLTAALVVPLLLGIATIPTWVSVAYCIIIATVAIGFVTASVNKMRGDSGMIASKQIEHLVVSFSLSMLQVIFILPVLICVYAPTLRL